MKKVAVFGNTGGGKSTLSRRLAEITGLPLHGLDLIQFRPGGAVVPREDYLAAHREILAGDAWIIDGYGCTESAWERFAQADTLVHVDLPLHRHFLWVTKRLLKSPFVAPEGWPDNSPVWRSTLNSCRVLWLCHRRLTPKYRRTVNEARASKRVHHLRSVGEIAAFLADVRSERAAPESAVPHLTAPRPPPA